MAKSGMRNHFEAYDHQLVDTSAKEKSSETVKKNGSKVSGPVPLPTKKEVVTILKSCSTNTKIQRAVRNRGTHRD